MDPSLVGSDILVHIQTKRVCVTIKGQSPDGTFREEAPFLGVLCADPCEVRLAGGVPARERRTGSGFQREYRTAPLFFAQRCYEILIEAAPGEEAAFWHSSAIRSRMNAGKSGGRVLSGSLQFGAKTGRSDLVVRIGGADYLLISAQVLPAEAIRPAQNEQTPTAPKVDWSVRDVLVGTLRRSTQLGVCLKHGFYHIPARQLGAVGAPIRYVALYQSRALFGPQAGIRYYGEVADCIPVRRSEIRELPSDRGDLYYRFGIREWRCLNPPIAAKEMGFVCHLTTLFLLEHSTETPQLWIQSEEEYRLYSAFKRAAASPGRVREIGIGAFLLRFDGDKALLLSQGRPIAQYGLSQFSRNPYFVLQCLQRDLRKAGHGRDSRR